MGSLLKAASVSLISTLLGVACGDSSQLLHPTAASALTASASQGPSAPPNGSPGSPVMPTNPVTGKVEIEGRVTSIIGNLVTVAGQAVLVPETAIIRYGSRMFTLADLRVGDFIHVSAYPTAPAGGTTALQATEVKVRHPDDDAEDDADDDGDEDDADDDDADDDADEEDEVEVEGQLSGLAGACPALSFTVRGRSVQTNGSTTFKNGPCSALRNGFSVEVEGRMQGATLVAKVVEIDR